MIVHIFLLVMSFVHDCIRLATIRQKRTIKRASSDRATVQCCRLCRVEQLDQLQTDLEENAGNWAREVKPLMRQGKHSSDVCFPLPNVPATSVKHFTIAPPLSARLPSPYQRLYRTVYIISAPYSAHNNVMVVSQNPSM